MVFHRNFALSDYFINHDVCIVMTACTCLFILNTVRSQFLPRVLFLLLS